MANMADDKETVPRSNLSASVAAMSQRLKEARQQNRLPQSAEKSSSILGGRSQSPTPPETTDSSSTPISVKAAQMDLELKIKELEVTSMTDRILESESRLTGVSSENTKLRNIIEQLELKLMRVMERNDDDIKERQLQWEEESGKIVKEFEILNRNMGEELDATKSALSLVQEDYRVAGEVVNRLQVELEEEKNAHAETQGTLSQSIAKIVQLKKEKGDVEGELEMTKAQLQMAMSSQGGSTQAEYEKLQLDNLSLRKKYSELQQEMEANDVDNGIDKYKEKIASLERELDDELQTSTSLRECLKEKDDSINNLRNELESAQVAHDQEISTLRSILADNSMAGQMTSIPPPLPKRSSSSSGSVPPRPIIFLDIDGVLNITKHNKQIQFEHDHLNRLKNIIQKTHALIVLSTFWRHFHSYITYVFHRHGIDVASCMLPLPMGATGGKQCTKKFLHFHRLKQAEHHDNCSDGTEESMIGRTAEDEAEYASRAEEIEAWLKLYGAKYLGGKNSNGNNSNNSIEGYEWHPEEWKYVILDDRPTAAKPDTPLFSRFVQTETKVGLSEDDEDWTIEILLSGPTDAQNRPLQRKPSLGVRSLDEIFSHKPCIAENLAVLLTPERSPIKVELKSDQPKEETLISADGETDADENNLKSSSHQSYESEILSAMCDYDNICPSLIALMQPPSMDDGNDAYSPARNMVKSFTEEEEKKSTSFEEGGGQHHINKDEKEKECNLLEQSESFDSDVPQSPPPMTMFLRMDTFSDENADHGGDEKDHDIGLDDLGSRWNKRPQLPFRTDDDDDGPD